MDEAKLFAPKINISNEKYLKNLFYMEVMTSNVGEFLQKFEERIHEIINIDKKLGRK